MIPMNRLHNFPGGNPVSMFETYGAFATTGTTVSVIVPFENVVAVNATYIGTPAASDGPLSVNNTISGTVGAGDAKIKGTSASGSTTLVVTRPAGTTTGQQFSLVAWGY